MNNQTQPKILSLRHILDEYLTFQEEVITRRTQYDLRKARERAHLLEGLLSLRTTSTRSSASSAPATTTRRNA